MVNNSHREGKECLLYVMFKVSSRLVHAGLQTLVKVLNIEQTLRLASEEGRYRSVVYFEASRYNTTSVIQ